MMTFIDFPTLRFVAFVLPSSHLFYFNKERKRTPTYATIFKIIFGQSKCNLTFAVQMKSITTHIHHHHTCRR